MAAGDMYDVIIIGGGGSGLTAALYTSRANLKTALFEKLSPGGQIALTHDLENYPGFPEGISGPDIAMKMEEQARKYGAVIFYEEANALNRLSSGTFEIKTASNVYQSRALILATGASFRTLNVSGEKTLTGRGVSYCATCDGAFFKNKEIVVVGGGDSALQEGIFLTKFASRVTVVHRRDKLRASPILQDRAKQNPKIQFVWDSVVEKIQGKERVESVVLKNVKDGNLQDFKTDGVFVFIGHTPNTAFLKDFTGLNEQGYLETDDSLACSVPGVFAAGECREGATRQLVAACGEGCRAALSAQHYLENLES